MTQRDKLWEKANQNPQSEWALKRQRGSHRLWESPTGQLLPIQPRKDGKAKSYQVQQFIKYQGEPE